jgi:arginine utilization protein RocB
MVIGKGGSEVEALRKALNSLTGKRVHINILEIKRADLDAQLVAENIARQLENRVSFRRAQNNKSNALCVLEHKELKQWFLVVLAVQISLVLNTTVKELFHCTHSC